MTSKYYTIDEQDYNRRKNVKYDGKVIINDQPSPSANQSTESLTQLRNNAAHYLKRFLKKSKQSEQPETDKRNTVPSNKQESFVSEEVKLKKEKSKHPSRIMTQVQQFNFIPDKLNDNKHHRHYNSRILGSRRLSKGLLHQRNNYFNDNLPSFGIEEEEHRQLSFSQHPIDSPIDYNNHSTRHDCHQSNQLKNIPDNIHPYQLPSIHSISTLEYQHLNLIPESNLKNTSGLLRERVRELSRSLMSNNTAEHDSKESLSDTRSSTSNNQQMIDPCSEVFQTQFNTNDLWKFLTQVLQDGSGNYQLIYNPTNGVVEGVLSLNAVNRLITGHEKLMNKASSPQQMEDTAELVETTQQADQRNDQRNVIDLRNHKSLGNDSTMSVGGIRGIAVNRSVEKNCNTTDLHNVWRAAINKQPDNESAEVIGKRKLNKSMLELDMVKSEQSNKEQLEQSIRNQQSHKLGQLLKQKTTGNNHDDNRIPLPPFPHPLGATIKSHQQINEDIIIESMKKEKINKTRNEQKRHRTKKRRQSQQYNQFPNTSLEYDFPDSGIAGDILWHATGSHTDNDHANMNTLQNSSASVPNFDMDPIMHILPRLTPTNQNRIKDLPYQPLLQDYQTQVPFNKNQTLLQDYEGHVPFNRNQTLIQDYEGHVKFNKNPPLLQDYQTQVPFNRNQPLLQDYEGHVPFNRNQTLLQDYQTHVPFNKNQPLLQDYEGHVPFNKNQPVLQDCQTQVPFNKNDTGFQYYYQPYPDVVTKCYRRQQRLSTDIIPCLCVD